MSIPNYEGGAVLVPVTSAGSNDPVGEPGVAGPVGPAAPVPPPPVILTKRARFNKKVKAAGMVALVVVILAARVYAVGHAF